MATYKILLYKHKELTAEKHPVLLQLSHHGKTKRITLTGMACKLSEWSEAASRFNETFSKHVSKNKALNRHDVRADDIISGFAEKGLPFTMNRFTEAFAGNKVQVTLYSYMEDIIHELIDVGEIGNKRVYKDALNALRAYHPKDDLMFADIDANFLRGWQTDFAKRGKAGTTALRTLRAVLNRAIGTKQMHRDLYPFKNAHNVDGYKIVKPKSTKTPKALSVVDLEKIQNFPLEAHPELAQSIRLFWFSFLCRGMNFTDMSLLKWSDIYSGRIEYIRAKTKKKGQATNPPLSIKVTEPIQEILDHFASDSQYVFPVLSDFHHSATQQKNRIIKCITRLNKDLKKIAKLLDVRLVLTSYTARHTYAACLFRSGTPASLISDALGHADPTVIKHYLAHFDNDALDEADKVLWRQPVKLRIAQ